jgi:hypothetical protein
VGGCNLDMARFEAWGAKLKKTALERAMGFGRRGIEGWDGGLVGKKSRQVRGCDGRSNSEHANVPCGMCYISWAGKSRGLS